MRLFGRTRPPKVYVDAKILNMHDPSLTRRAYAGYVVEGHGRQNVREVNATESDDAEVMAILFAIDELKGSMGRFTVVCDHESVVSEANRDVVKNPSEFLLRLRKTLQENRSIKLEALMSNPAHRVLTEYVNSVSSEPQA
jgi:ribonuclease HI